MKQIYIKINIFLFVFFSIFLYSCSSDASVANNGNCDTSCQYWEYCNVNTNKCELNTESEFCSQNDDCVNNKTCNLDNHLCEVKLSNCKDGCYDWEECIEGICQLQDGACYWDEDCADNQYCSLDSNKCLSLSDSCDLECESWEKCTFNDSSQKECIPRSDFNWSRLNLLNNESIKMPYGINTFAYDTKNKTMLNYLELSGNLTPERQAIIGKLDLGTGEQEEKFLSEREPLDIDLGCRENSKNCEFITYDKDTESFILLSLKSSYLLYFNYYNIFKKTFVFTDIPKFSENISTTFSKDNKNLLVYNNKNETENNSSELYQFSIENMEWKLLVSNLPNVSCNCLIENDGIVYSFGGILSYNRNKTRSYISKYYEISTEDSQFTSFDMPVEFNERANISCAYDSKRDLIFLYGGTKVINQYNELDNNYYSDLWAFNPSTREWKKIFEITDLGNFLPPDEMGNRIFNANIEVPSFGKNKGRMIYDEVKDRLILLGEVPPEKGVQLYTISLSNRKQ